MANIRLKVQVLVRSARVPMCSLREMWGGVFCFYGYQGGRDKNNMKDWIEANSSVKKLKYPYLNWHQQEHRLVPAHERRRSCRAA